MKKKIIILMSLLCLLGVAVKGASCGTIIATREIMLAHMQDLVDIEYESRILLHIIRESQQRIPTPVLKLMKTHYDNFYVYHAAAMNDLANADITTYQRRIEKAREELKTMEELLRKHIAL